MSTAGRANNALRARHGFQVVTGIEFAVTFVLLTARIENDAVFASA
ncbi:hypothetical protein HLG76_10065 [Salinivibrio sp. EAGSL]|nr:hypothetical protein [Salinivibrio sp. EAGSL]NUY56897.1 hypothetical protein [Salinivibrio sp. EAGSL]